MDVDSVEEVKHGNLAKRDTNALGKKWINQTLLLTSSGVLGWFKTAKDCSTKKTKTKEFTYFARLPNNRRCIF